MLYDSLDLAMAVDAETGKLTPEVYKRLGTIFRELGVTLDFGSSADLSDFYPESWSVTESRIYVASEKWVQLWTVSLMPVKDEKDASLCAAGRSVEREGARVAAILRAAVLVRNRGVK